MHPFRRLWYVVGLCRQLFHVYVTPNISVIFQPFVKRHLDAEDTRLSFSFKFFANILHFKNASDCISSFVLTQPLYSHFMSQIPSSHNVLTTVSPIYHLSNPVCTYNNKKYFIRSCLKYINIW